MMRRIGDFAYTNEEKCRYNSTAVGEERVYFDFQWSRTGGCDPGDQDVGAEVED